MTRPLTVLKQALPFALAVGIWLVPVPAGLTPPAWHLFAVFASAIASVLIGSFPLLTSALLAVAAAVLTGTVSPAKAFAGFANASVLLVVIAFLVAIAVVKSGLGRANQPVDGQPVRPIVHRACLQYRHHGRAHRSGLSQQHGARRCSVSDRAVGCHRVRFATG